MEIFIINFSFRFIFEDDDFDVIKNFNHFPEDNEIFDALSDYYGTNYICMKNSCDNILQRKYIVNDIHMNGYCREEIDSVNGFFIIVKHY